MKKILYTSNTYRHLYLCHIPYFKMLKSSKIIVDTATNSDKKIEFINNNYYIPIKRNPFNISNIISIFKLKNIIETNKYDIIHTHTPTGATVTRLAAIKARKRLNLKVIYTAHGFHFYKNCPKINYLLYYPIEKMLSKYTDLIITINKEDYDFAKKHFKSTIKYIPGVGFDISKFKTHLDKSSKEKLKNKYNINPDDYVISYIAEFSKRKNQLYLLKVLNKMNLEKIKVLLIGDDKNYKKKALKYIAKKKLSNNIILINFTADVSKFLDITDLVVSVSKQEGLPLNIMEAMYKEKPIIVSNCRGNRDLIKNNYNGIVVEQNNKEDLKNAIISMKNNLSEAKKMAHNAKIESLKYSTDKILPIVKKLYEEML